ncbi:MAG: ATP-binding cassette domain-containing protein, partial [Firmicutes bacterium]|nr:ATP-binding cassette domain-containing protein [Bacillota bacterium]
MQQNKNVLLRITNLKQYFPLKKRGLYVKANDGITLDIYEGEVFGLVGESGCGKSTLGRTLLQLYRQTDGRTMYYGKTLDDIAPNYMLKTLRQLHKRIEKIHTTEARRDELQKAYDALSEQEQYAKHAELDAAKKAANDALLDVANIVGGLMVADDLGAVSSAYEKQYTLALKRRNLREKRKEVQVRRDDAEFAKKKVDSYDSKLKEIDNELETLSKDLAKAEDEIEVLRNKYRDKPDFEKFEALRDNGIDLARLTYNEIRLLR